MPRPKTRKTKSLISIRNYIKRGLTANEIQRRLKKRKLGMRRKRILQEIRLIKKQKLTPEKAQKYIPKKYRKEKPIFPPPPKMEIIFRLSQIISDVPVHSKPFARNYLGFRLQAYHINKNVLSSKRIELKNMLLKLTSDYLGYDILDWEGYDVYIGVETPTAIMTANRKMINNRWIFKVEKQGIEKYSKSGYL